MNKFVIIILAVFVFLGIFIVFIVPNVSLFRYGLFGACTKDGLICPDGGNPGNRQGIFCQFKPGCIVKYCDKSEQCPEGMKCYKFPNTERNPYNLKQYKAYCSTYPNAYTSLTFKDCKTSETEPIELMCSFVRN